jgi:anti-sigma B factor antagonist
VHATIAVSIRIEEREGGIRLVRAAGELDALGAPVLHEYLDQRVFPGHDFILDLDGVTFLGSAGMRVLMDAQGKAARYGLHWALVGSRRPVSRPLWATGLCAQLPVQPSVSEALRVLTAKVAGARPRALAGRTGRGR